MRKYRLSNRRRSSHKGIISDESLVNYDAFEVGIYCFDSLARIVIYTNLHITEQHKNITSFEFVSRGSGSEE